MCIYKRKYNLVKYVKGNEIQKLDFPIKTIANDVSNL